MFDAIEGDGTFFRCTEIRRRGPTRVAASRYAPVCGIAGAMWGAEQAWRSSLAGVTIAALAATTLTDAPPEAVAKGLKTGRGVARCVVAPDGALTGCTPAPGDPDGVGFSEAAVKLAASMRMNPWTADGGPVDGAVIRLPIRFNLAAKK